RAWGASRSPSATAPMPARPPAGALMTSLPPSTGASRTPAASWQTHSPTTPTPSPAVSLRPPPFSGTNALAQAEGLGDLASVINTGSAFDQAIAAGPFDTAE